METFILLSCFIMGSESVVCPHNGVYYETLLSCYWKLPEKRSAGLSHLACKQDGGVLAPVKDSDTSTFLRQSYGTVLEQGLDVYYGIWIGLRDTVTEGQFLTFEDETNTWTNWRSGDPNDDGTPEQDCVAMYPKDFTTPYSWQDRNCDESKQALCVKKIMTETTTQSEQQSTQTIINITTSDISITDSATGHQMATEDASTIASSSNGTQDQSTSIRENATLNIIFQETSQPLLNFSNQNTISTESNTYEPTGLTDDTDNFTTTSDIENSTVNYFNYSDTSGADTADDSTSVAITTPSIFTTPHSESMTTTSLFTSTRQGSTEKESTSTSGLTTDVYCNCKCKTKVILDPEELDRLVTDLVISKKNTSASRRKLISASDDRPSARNLGYFGATLLGIVLALIILLDTTSLFTPGH